MTYAEALEWLKKQEGGIDALEAVQAHVSSVNNGEKEYRRKLREAEATLTRMKEETGEEDAGKAIKELRAQIDTVTKERDELKTNGETITKERDDLKAASIKYERDKHFRSASEKVGADYEAFTNIFKDISIENVLVKDDGVTIKNDGKDVNFTDYIEALEGWKKRALFPDKEQPPTNNYRPQLPTGNTSGAPPQPQSVVADYIGANYARFNKS